MNRYQIRLDHPLILGSGVAGLSVALGLPEATVLTVGLGSTRLAQGGIAAAVGTDDNPGLHARDTRAVAGGLSVDAAVEILCRGGPEAIHRLRRLGARFDRHPDGRLRLGLEAGHRRRRIVAARGDSIGAELVHTLCQAARAAASIHLEEGWTAIDLLRHGDTVTGVVAADPAGRRQEFLARGVVVATGGAGHLYLRTTNPPDVHGSGVAMAARAGARLADLEFVQFHPTALDIGSDPMPLVSEALRGEGAVLVDETGRRFVPNQHRDAELAPRDVVARAVWHHQRLGHNTYLDARDVPDVVVRFPTVGARAEAAGLHPARHLLPVSPAAHYLMGGIDVDTHGRASLQNLWTVGEAAASGVHGANRLASNSLLEGLVFAARAASDIPGDAREPKAGGTAPEAAYEATFRDAPEMQHLRRVMWDKVGVVRTRSGLEAAARIIADLRPALAGTVSGRVAADVASWILTAARGREESRGSHFRADLPHPDPRLAHRRILDPALIPAGGGP